MFQSRKEVKTAVSALRRELSSLGKAVSHNQGLDLLARILGHKNWPECLAAHPHLGEDIATPDSTSSLLRNKGQFDFPGGTQVLDGNFNPIAGTLDDIPRCIAGINSATRSEEGAGRLAPEYAGETEVNWDGQVQRKDKDGMPLWAVEGSGDAVREDLLLLVPEGFYPENDDLPIREPLVAEFRKHLKANKADSRTLDRAELELGFSLTSRERKLFD